MEECIKCGREKVYHQLTGLGYTCYHYEYRKGNIPQDNPQNWNLNGPYDEDFLWLEKLKKLQKNNNNFFLDEERRKLIYVVRSKKEMIEKEETILALKKCSKDVEVRDEGGNYITLQHDFLKKRKKEIKVKV